MSTSKSPIVEKSIKHSVSPIRDVLVVPPGATETKETESMHTHPALLVEQRTSQNTSTSPIVTSSASSAKSNRTGIETGIVAVKQSHKSHKSEKEKAVSVSPKTRREGRRRKVKGKGNKKRTRHAGRGGSGTRKKYNRKLRKTRCRR
jgi:hypothetical protein